MAAPCVKCGESWPDNHLACPADGTPLVQDEEAMLKACQTVSLQLEVPFVPSAPRFTIGEGTQIGEYVVERQIAKGGMGAIFSARHPVLGKKAAIKIIHSELSDDKSLIERFVREAQAVNMVRHPNIVDVFSIGALPDGRSYFVMDWLDGVSLGERIRKGGAIPLPEAAWILDETADAMAAAHAAGIVHRDLKPPNIFLEENAGNQRVRVLDFGIAKLSSNREVTSVGILLGTPAYLAPEQATTSNVDHRADIYALGVVAFEMLSGKRPFAGNDMMALLQSHQAAAAPRLGSVADVPREIDEMVARMLEKDPDDRPSLDEVRRVLRPFAVKPDGVARVTDSAAMLNAARQAAAASRTLGSRPRPRPASGSQPGAVRDAWSGSGPRPSTLPSGELASLATGADLVTTPAAPRFVPPGHDRQQLTTVQQLVPTDARAAAAPSPVGRVAAGVLIVALGVVAYFLVGKTASSADGPDPALPATATVGGEPATPPATPPEPTGVQVAPLVLGADAGAPAAVVDPPVVRVGELVVTVSGENARVEVDGRVVGEAVRRATAEVEAGRHQIVVTASDGRSRRRDVLVEPGRPLAIDIDLPPAAGNPRLKPKNPPDRRQPDPEPSADRVLALYESTGALARELVEARSDAQSRALQDEYLAIPSPYTSAPSAMRGIEARLKRLRAKVKAARKAID